MPEILGVTLVAGVRPNFMKIAPILRAMRDRGGGVIIIVSSIGGLRGSDVIGAYWHAYLQLRPGIMTPPAEVKPETEIYRALAGRLGLSSTFIASLPGPSDAVAGPYGLAAAGDLRRRRLRFRSPPRGSQEKKRMARTVPPTSHRAMTPSASHWK